MSSPGWLLWLFCLCKRCYFSPVQLIVTRRTAACQTPLLMGFARQEYWSGLPCPPSGVFPTQGPNMPLLHLLHWQAGSSPLAPPFCLGQNQGADNLGSYLEALGRHLLPNSFRLLAKCSSDGCRTVSLLSAIDNT